MLKRASIANLLAREEVSDGDILRCLDTQRNTVLVGKVVNTGIQIPGKTDKTVNLTQFEKIAGVSRSYGRRRLVFPPLSRGMPFLVSL